MSMINRGKIRVAAKLNKSIPKGVALDKFGKVPDLGITFKIDKVYIQTPGPDAGKEITNSETK